MSGAKRTRPAPLHLLEREQGGHPWSSAPKLPEPQLPRLWLQRGNVCLLQLQPRVQRRVGAQRAAYVLGNKPNQTKTQQQNLHHVDSRYLTASAVAQPKPSTCGRLRQEDSHQFQVSLGFGARLGLKRTHRRQQNKKQNQHQKVGRRAKCTGPTVHTTAPAPHRGGRGARGGTSAHHFRFRFQMNSPATEKERLSARVFLPVWLLAG